MNDEKKLPTVCPSCGFDLTPKRLACSHCETLVEGTFELPVLVRLSHEDQEFVQNFVKSSGSLKDLARQYGVSYPTVRNRLDSLIGRVQTLESRSREEKGVQQDRSDLNER
jgi:hypothetical protein